MVSVFLKHIDIEPVFKHIVLFKHIIIEPVLANGQQLMNIAGKQITDEIKGSLYNGNGRVGSAACGVVLVILPAGSAAGVVGAAKVHRSMVKGSKRDCCLLECE